MTTKPVSSQPDDRALAELVWRDRDEQAFRTLYQRHTPRLYQFVLRVMAGNEQDAEDVVQETWIRAVDKLRQFRWDASLNTWLAGIALNLCRGFFRRQDRRWVEIREDLGLLVPPRLEHERIDLEEALTKLAPGYRTVLILHDIEGFTHEQIAGQLEVSVNTSKSQLFHARRTLRSLVAPTGGEEART